MDINKIFENNAEWVAAKLKTSPDYFKNLADGQNPKYLYIGCSDSRVTAETLMGAAPGEVFVHRNIANLAPNNDLSSLSVINYAVSILKVEHVIVCGHYGCGGIQAAMQATDMGILNPWLRNIRDVFRLHKEELNAITDKHKRYNRLAELNVIEQCVNIAKTTDVQQAFIENRITIHAWIFDMETGKLMDLKFNLPDVEREIRSIYRLL